MGELWVGRHIVIREEFPWLQGHRKVPWRCQVTRASGNIGRFGGNQEKVIQETL
jgi:hypothetical protein